MLKKNSQCHTPYPRYDSQGRHLDSLPDIITPRADHACATFVSSRGEQVGFQKLTIFYLMTIEKGFPDHGRCRQQWRAIEHRVVLAVKEEMDTGGKSSTVRFTVKTIITVAINNTSNNYFSHACNHSLKLKSVPAKQRFPRSLRGLRAAHLRQQVVVTGGHHGGWKGSGSGGRSEVLPGYCPD